MRALVYHLRAWAVLWSAAVVPLHGWMENVDVLVSRLREGISEIDALIAAGRAEEGLTEITDRTGGSAMMEKFAESVLLTSDWVWITPKLGLSELFALKRIVVRQCEKRLQRATRLAQHELELLGYAKRVSEDIGESTIRAINAAIAGAEKRRDKCDQATGLLVIAKMGVIGYTPEPPTTDVIENIRDTVDETIGMLWVVDRVIRLIGRPNRASIDGRYVPQDTNWLEFMKSLSRQPSLESPTLSSFWKLITLIVNSLTVNQFAVERHADRLRLDSDNTQKVMVASSLRFRALVAQHSDNDRIGNYLTEYANELRSISREDNNQSWVAWINVSLFYRSYIVSMLQIVEGKTTGWDSRLREKVNALRSELGFGNRALSELMGSVASEYKSKYITPAMAETQAAQLEYTNLLTSYSKIRGQPEVAKTLLIKIQNAIAYARKIV